MKKILTVIFLFIFDSQVKAEPFLFMSSISTVELVETCNNSQSNLNFDGCVGYILGVADEAIASHEICTPNHFSTYQAVAVTRKYLNDHPEKWSIGPSFLVAEALRTIYACN